MKPFVSLFAVTASLLIESCSLAPAPKLAQAQERGAPRVRIATLLADPTAYQGKLVRVGGPAVGLFEVSYVCDDLATMRRNESKKCLWVTPGTLEFADYNGKFVEFIGTFDQVWQGHGGAYGGSIAPIHLTEVGVHDFDGGPPPPEPHQ